MAYAAAAVLAVLVSVTASFAGGEACNNVASMTWTDACQQTGRWERLCQETLQNAPDAAKVTEYALIATRLAKLRYEDTLIELDPMLGAGNLPGPERSAISNCKQRYALAVQRMAAVAGQLLDCNFSFARQEYIDAQVAVGLCQQGLQPYQFLPLFDKVSADHDLTMVAYFLGAIFLGR